MDMNCILMFMIIHVFQRILFAIHGFQMDMNCILMFMIIHVFQKDFICNLIIVLMFKIIIHAFQKDFICILI